MGTVLLLEYIDPGTSQPKQAVRQEDQVSLQCKSVSRASPAAAAPRLLGLFLAVDGEVNPHLSP